MCPRFKETSPPKRSRHAPNRCERAVPSSQNMRMTDWPASAKLGDNVLSSLGGSNGASRTAGVRPSGGLVQRPQHRFLSRGCRRLRVFARRQVRRRLELYLGYLRRPRRQPGYRWLRNGFGWELGERWRQYCFERKWRRKLHRERWDEQHRWSHGQRRSHEQRFGGLRGQLLGERWDGRGSQWRRWRWHRTMRGRGGTGVLHGGS